MLSTPNIMPSAWFNRGNPTLAATSSAGMDPYPYSFDPSSSLQLDKPHQIQTQSLPPAAFGLPTTTTTTTTTKPTAQSHVPSQNNPGTTTTTNSGLFNSSGITKSVSYSFRTSFLFYSFLPFVPVPASASASALVA